ncbi:MAG TPA: hypothetical protein VF498_03775 [Anaerolineales bacterium]
MLAEPLAITLLVIDAFERLEVPYLIGGSLASALHGTARSTLDTDLVADLKAKQVTSLVNMLKMDFYIDEEMILDAIRYQSSFNVIHLTTMFKVDVFISKHRRFDQIQFQRRQLQILANEPERKAYVTTAEDIILAKLEWYRQGNEISDRQWRDILGVLKVQAGRLDLDYLNQWAVELKVADLLQRALKESE